MACVSVLFVTGARGAGLVHLIRFAPIRLKRDIHPTDRIRGRGLLPARQFAARLLLRKHVNSRR